MKNLFISTAIVFACAIFARSQMPMFHQDVSWSPDGKYLAFTGMHDFDEQRRNFKADIYVIRADGSDLRMISASDKKSFYTSWGKDRVAFGVDVAGTKDSDIYTAKPDGSDLRQVTKGERNATPSISRDGKRIA